MKFTMTFLDNLFRAQLCIWYLWVVHIHSWEAIQRKSLKNQDAISVISFFLICRKLPISDSGIIITFEGAVTICRPVSKNWPNSNRRTCFRRYNWRCCNFLSDNKFDFYGQMLINKFCIEICADISYTGCNTKIWQLKLKLLFFSIFIYFSINNYYACS